MRIIYFDIDCLRPDHLGCYGYMRPSSPTIDTIAAQGMRFNHYYCASSPCLPSRTALFSGRFGINNGVLSNHGAGARYSVPLYQYGGPEIEYQSVMRFFRENGYDTISFSNFADRHYALWFMHGWSEFHTPNLKCGGETGDEINEKVIPWLKNNATRENYFLHINYWDTHTPYRMNASWANRFKEHPLPQSWPDEAAIREHQSITGPFTAGSLSENGTSRFPLMPGMLRTRKDVEHLVTGYDSAIAYADAHVQEVLDELERQGVLDDAIIIVSSDHGDAFGERGIYSDHTRVDECVHRIPLIIRWPGVCTPGSVCDSFMYNVDLAPTLCDALAFEHPPRSLRSRPVYKDAPIVPFPPRWDGMSYAAVLKGELMVDRDYLVWDSGLYTVQRAVRTKTHLFIRTYHAFTYNNIKPVELYDMTRDPYQEHDIAGDCPGIVHECEGMMDAWVREQAAKPFFTRDPLTTILEERGMYPHA